MRRFLLIIMMLVPFSVMAAIPELNTLLDKYSNNTSVIATVIDRNMMTLFAGEMEGLEAVDSIVVLLSEDATTGDAIIADAKAMAERAKAETLVSHTSDEANVAVYCLKDGDMITDIIVLIGDDEQRGVSVISGSMNIDDIGKLIQVQM